MPFRLGPVELGIICVLCAMPITVIGIIAAVVISNKKTNSNNQEKL